MDKLKTIANNKIAKITLLNRLQFLNPSTTTVVIKADGNNAINTGQKITRNGFSTATQPSILQVIMYSYLLACTGIICMIRII